MSKKAIYIDKDGQEFLNIQYYKLIINIEFRIIICRRKIFVM